MVKGTPKTPKTPKTTPTQTQTPTRTPKRKESTKQLALELPEEPSEKENADSVKRPRQSVISTFFHRVDKPAPPPTVPPSILNTRFRPFQLKEGMRIAPVLMRRPLNETEYHNFLRSAENEASDFLARCKTKRQKHTATNTDAQKPKYYHFHDNYRPPYWGTWRRRSAQITGRRPFGREETLNYEENSDEEWEEEPEDADECKSDEEIERDDDVMDDEENDGFFVAHGYLSDDEGSDGDDESDGVDKNQRKLNESDRDAEESEEQRQKRLAQKAQEWQESIRQKERRARKREELKPKLYMPMTTDPQFLSQVPSFCLPAVRFDYSKLVCVDNPTNPAAVGDAPCSSSSAVAVVAASVVNDV
ncbi:hypothetical protein niasHT_023991 [Heterodera trifolii]|uniref:Chromatin assembly factor 1 subunit A dimerization domain-containing protein n=1 Tax=Heterodera trifolii TaxID=157864 RepID=A0ABD2KPB0_9BILA